MVNKKEMKEDLMKEDLADRQLYCSIIMEIPLLWIIMNILDRYTSLRGASPVLEFLLKN